VETPITDKELEKLKTIIPERLAEKPSEIVLVKPCMGGPFHTVMVSFNHD